MADTFSIWPLFEDWLNRKGLFHMRLGQERMLQAMRVLKLQNLPFKIVQILGTNGKGSTAAFLDALAQRHGCKTGLYTSPHFVSPKERILISGRQIDDAAWLGLAGEIQASPAGSLDLTYFEFLTILALMVFREEKIDLAILEAGLGGANDATTTARADARCYAPIAMDHAAIIGPSLADIARDKAAAMQDAAPVFSAPQFALAKSVLEENANGKGAAIAFVEPLPKERQIGLFGPHQRLNAALALAAWRHLAPLLKVDSQRRREDEALQTAFIPGRMQFISGNDAHPALILDGAHNPHGMQSLVKGLDQLGLTPSSLVFSCLDDKDWRPGLAMLCRKLGDSPVFVAQLDNDRAARAEDVASFCEENLCRQAVIFHGANALRDALEQARQTQNGGAPALLCGSLYLLSKFYELYPRYLQA